MTAREMLRLAANLGADDISRMAVALGWPTVEQMREGAAFDVHDFTWPAHFHCEPEDRDNFEPFAVWVLGPMSVTTNGRYMVALRLLAEDAAGEAAVTR